MKRREVLPRACGILLPVFSLPSAYGIGGYSKEARAFIDFLSDAGQTYWQMLPLGPTSFGASPYQSFSTFAGNLYFIDIEQLIEDGMLTRSQARGSHTGFDTPYIDYDSLHRKRRKLLRKAYNESGFSLIGSNRPDRDIEKEFEAFVEAEKDWLEDYALFIAIKDANGGKPWNEWEEGLRLRRKDALKKAAEEHADQINFCRFVQFMIARQFKAMRDYARQKDIMLIGDIPIYVAYDGSDTWARPELFELDREGLPVEVAGCPPDAFSATGQLWGNPLYRWDVHKDSGYDWWKKRLEAAFRQADVVRIDHFRGFESYYCIPYGASTAVHGVWRKGPGMDLFRAAEDILADREVIAEDLGFLTPAVHRLLARSRFPGMKVLQFAFDSREESDYLPHNYDSNCVVYTGTHDNQTTAGWVGTLNRHDRTFAKRYLQVRSDKALVRAMICAALSSVSRTAIIPVQDYLGLGDEARINTPSTIGGNWMWRMRPDQLTGVLAKEIYDLSRLYGRVPGRKETV